MFRNGEHYKALIPEGMNYRNEIRVREDSPSSWYVRVTQHDNHIAWSSPVWFE
jgi:uncharacterized membrane protein